MLSQPQSDVRQGPVVPMRSGRSGELIAIVDDDELVGATLAALLAEAGFQTALFQDGLSAIRFLADGGDPAAVLLDWAMPRMDGAEVLRQIRSAGHDVPVLFLTGHGQQILEESALSSGAADFVEKTKGFSILLRRLRLALAKKRPVDPLAQMDGLTIDSSSCRVYWRGRQVQLTLSEFKVVRLLTSKMGRNCSYREIYDLLRGEGFQAGNGDNGYRVNVRAIVMRIRRKFQEIDPSFDAIGTRAGIGYHWRPQPHAAEKSPAGFAYNA